MRDKSKHRIAIVILAAGASKRMPEIKQLLPWKQTTLIGHVIEQCIASKAAETFVVLGAHADEISKVITNQKAHILFNEKWEQGMGTSIAAAMRYFEKNSIDFDAFLFVLVDQPLLDFTYFNTLINKYLESEKNIIASQFNKGAGVPVLLNKIYFKELKKLDQDYGAKRILTENWEDVFVINSEGKNQDVDTLEAYKNLFEQFGK